MNLVAKTRGLIIGWGIALTGFTLLLNFVREGIPIISLAFGMTAYTMGPLLGLMFCALAGRGNIRGLLAGCAISLLLVAFIRTDIWVLWIKGGGSFQWLAQLPTYRLNEAATGIDAVYQSAWAWPLTTAITFCCGYFFAKPTVQKTI
jgi:hypothetical protein